jgi:hypothetical protein
LLRKFKRVREKIFVFGQWFFALLNNGENRGFGFESVSFGLKKVFGSCLAIDRD